MPPTQCCGAAYALVAWRSRGHIWAVKGTRTALQPAPFRRYGPQGENHWIGRPREADLRTKRSEEHTSELQSLMRNSYAVFCLKKKKKHQTKSYHMKTK